MFILYDLENYYLHLPYPDRTITRKIGKIEDLSMYTENKDRILNMNVPIRFIAPANIREIASPDPDIIIGKWENAKGIIDCIEKIMQSVKIKGGMQKDE